MSIPPMTSSIAQLSESGLSAASHIDTYTPFDIPSNTLHSHSSAIDSTRQPEIVETLIVDEAESTVTNSGANQKPPLDAELESLLLLPTGTHIKYRTKTTNPSFFIFIEFSVGHSNFFCRIFFAEQFDALRRKCDCEATFIQSLSRCARWNASGGASGSTFFKTLDDRFVVKQMSKAEMEAFLRFAPLYFEYMSQSLFHDLPTTLAKLFGVYRLGFKNALTGKNVKLDVLVMENLFYNRQISKVQKADDSTFYSLTLFACRPYQTDSLSRPHFLIAISHCHIASVTM